MPKMVHPDLGEDRAVDAFPQQVGPYSASGWEVVEEGDQPAADSSADGQPLAADPKPASRQKKEARADAQV